ncbi:Oidioi.mRNA.OKI2018_I69.PAR.g11711.t1.cds [Oikopleura dioica]|uniref:Oidioi.mRNA.OKI2018_I69.PAR.g11711.t1.cds n=1 Tax=Oikopleura dioica TaxID=34765 RepID=A0ABN7RX05_OIKDI|nr:Oidioi.mRNA.OKI2018_I69.PAR.g11711.t1.cds [Oikopleura dioica]
MPWRYIDPIYEKLSRHSTIYGKYWHIFVTVFRISVLPFADSCWSDEQKEFKCNTQEVGCPNVCFNAFAPINQVRLWSMQVLAITAPLCLYIVYVCHLAENRREKEKRENEEGTNNLQNQSSAAIRRRKIADQKLNHGCAAHEKLNMQIIMPDYLNAVREDSTKEKRLWRLYILMVISRTLIDAVFIYFQWTIYPYKEYIPDVYKSAITALLNLAELIYIGVRRLRVAFCGAYGGVDPMFEDPSEVESVFSQQTGRSSKASSNHVRLKTPTEGQRSPTNSTPSPVLKMQPGNYYHYSDGYYERRPTLLYKKREDREPNDPGLTARNLTVDDGPDRFRRGSIYETYLDSKNNKNNNCMLQSCEVMIIPPSDDSLSLISTYELNSKQSTKF